MNHKNDPKFAHVKYAHLIADMADYKNAIMNYAMSMDNKENNQQTSQLLRKRTKDIAAQFVSMVISKNAYHHVRDEVGQDPHATNSLAALIVAHYENHAL